MSVRLNFYSKYNLARHHIQIDSLLDIARIPGVRSILNDTFYLEALHANP